MRPRVLFFAAEDMDYLSDGLLHGLRQVLGASVIDYPKAERLYESYSGSSAGQLYGRGFTLTRVLPEVPLERGQVLDRAVRGEFDLVVFGRIWHTFELYRQLVPRLAERVQVAVVDGEDSPALFPYSGLFWRRPQWGRLPRPNTRHAYFKRELGPETTRSRVFHLLPRAVCRLLPFPRNVRPIGFAIPEEKIVAQLPAVKSRLLATHVVDPEVALLVPGGQTEYAFTTEATYYADLRAARFAVTTRRSGWDCMRHYEIAANGCVSCFRDLDRKPASSAPHGLDRRNCVVYRDARELMSRLRAMSDEEYKELQIASLAWVRRHTTRVLALEFLASLGWPPSEVPPR